MKYKPRKKLREVRKKRGYSQEKIAERIGIARSTYSGYETGFSNPSLEIALRIKEILKYPEDDIFFND